MGIPKHIQHPGRGRAAFTLACLLALAGADGAVATPGTAPHSAARGTLRTPSADGYLPRGARVLWAPMLAAASARAGGATDT